MGDSFGKPEWGLFLCTNCCIRRNVRNIHYFVKRKPPEAAALASPLIPRLSLKLENIVFLSNRKTILKSLCVATWPRAVKSFGHFGLNTALAVVSSLEQQFSYNAMFQTSFPVDYCEQRGQAASCLAGEPMSQK